MVYFIINPISGSGKGKVVGELVTEVCRSIEYEIVYTKANTTIKELMSDYELNSDSVLVAAGGDGTVSTIASYCYELNCKLGIIPLGSGNGLARHLGIPLDSRNAIKQILSGNSLEIDVCKMNENLFFNVSGIGFDGYVAELFDKAKGRGFWNYVKAIFRGVFNYRKERLEIEIDGQLIEVNSYLVSFANSSQYGNNTWIAPKAEINDGWIDIVVVSNLAWYNILTLGILIKMKLLHWSKSVKFYKGKKIFINKFDNKYAHFDGEPIYLNDSLNVELLDKRLTVII